MKLNKTIFFCCISVLTFGLLVTSCQKFERPELNLILDPPPPAYNPLKSFWAFENDVTDEGENKFMGTAVNLTYTAGVSGQAIKVGNN